MKKKNKKIKNMTFEYPPKPKTDPEQDENEKEAPSIIVPEQIGTPRTKEEIERFKQMREDAERYIKEQEEKKDREKELLSREQKGEKLTVKEQEFLHEMYTEREERKKRVEGEKSRETTGEEEDKKPKAETEAETEEKRKRQTREQITREELERLLASAEKLGKIGEDYEKIPSKPAKKTKERAELRQKELYDKGAFDLIEEIAGESDKDIRARANKIRNEELERRKEQGQIKKIWRAEFIEGEGRKETLKEVRVRYMEYNEKRYAEYYKNKRIEKNPSEIKAEVEKKWRKMFSSAVLERDDIVEEEVLKRARKAKDENGALEMIEEGTEKREEQEQKKKELEKRYRDIFNNETVVDVDQLYYEIDKTYTETGGYVEKEWGNKDELKDKIRIAIDALNQIEDINEYIKKAIEIAKDVPIWGGLRDWVIEHLEPPFSLVVDREDDASDSDKSEPPKSNAQENSGHEVVDLEETERDKREREREIEKERKSAIDDAIKYLWESETELIDEEKVEEFKERGIDVYQWALTEKDRKKSQANFRDNKIENGEQFLDFLKEEFAEATGEKVRDGYTFNEDQFYALLNAGYWPQKTKKVGVFKVRTCFYNMQGEKVEKDKEQEFLNELVEKFKKESEERAKERLGENSELGKKRGEEGSDKKAEQEGGKGQEENESENEGEKPVRRSMDDIIRDLDVKLDENIDTIIEQTYRRIKSQKEEFRRERGITLSEEELDREDRELREKLEELREEIGRRRQKSKEQPQPKPEDTSKGDKNRERGDQEEGDQEDRLLVKKLAILLMYDKKYRERVMRGESVEELSNEKADDIIRLAKENRDEEIDRDDVWALLLSKTYSGIEELEDHLKNKITGSQKFARWVNKKRFLKIQAENARRKLRK